MTRFVIVNASRSGSTMLGSALMAHPEIIMHGEIFGYPYYTLDFHGLDNNLRWPTPLELYLKRVRDTDVIRFLNELVFAPTGRNAIGFKFKFQEFHLWPKVASYIAEQNLQIIYLRRRNLWQRYLSEMETIVSGVYNTDDVTTRGPEDLKHLGIEFTPERVLASFVESEGFDRQFDELFGKNPTLRLDYEELVANYRDSLFSVTDFLGLDRVEVLPTTNKFVGKKRVEELIDIPGIKRHFAGSHYEKFFM